MARIAFWLADLNVESGGVGPYAWRLLETILSRLDETPHHLLVLCGEENEALCKQLLARRHTNAGLILIPSSWQADPTLLSRVGQRLRRFLLPSRLLQHLDQPWFSWFASLKLDLLHIPYQAGPPLPLPCPFIFTPHDVQELHFPEFFTPRDRAQRAVNNWMRAEQCSAAIVSFPFVKDDLRTYFGLADEKIHVCPLPYPKVLLRTPTKEQAAEYKSKYALWRPFVLYPAQTWQHKNHLTLIRAIQHVKEQTGKQVHLIATGRKNPEFFPVIERNIVRLEVAEQIHFVDIVPESELRWLYENCSMVVIPSLYEAGCFPLLEAMLLQAPVICSSVTHLPETIGDDRFVFDPLDAEALGRLIVRGLDDPEFRSANLANSRRRTEQLQQIDPFACILRAWNSVLPG